jgi:hypothetical protein
MWYDLLIVLKNEHIVAAYTVNEETDSRKATRVKIISADTYTCIPLKMGR